MLWTAVITAFLSAGGIVLGWYLNEGTRSRGAQLETDRRRADFQRVTMLELQEAMSALTRATYQIHNADSTAEREGVQWGTNRVGEELGEQHRGALRRTYILNSRVANVDIRNACQAVIASSNAAIAAPSQAVGTIETHTTGDLANAATEVIGELLRDLL